VPLASTNQDTYMKHYKRYWSEDRGDAYADWGSVTYYFEVGDDLFVTRQIEIYQNGFILKYDKNHLADEYGMLVDKPIDPGDFEPYAIPGEVFESIWESSSRFIDVL
jgi:hypothetical protein